MCAKNEPMSVLSNWKSLLNTESRDGLWISRINILVTLASKLLDFTSVNAPRNAHAMQGFEDFKARNIFSSSVRYSVAHI